MRMNRRWVWLAAILAAWLWAPAGVATASPEVDVTAVDAVPNAWVRSPWPGDAAEWQRLAGAAYRLPARLAGAYWDAARQLGEALGSQGIVVAAAGLLLMVVAAFFLRRRWRQLTLAGTESTWRACVRLAGDSILGFVLPAWLLLLGIVIEFSARDWALWLTPALVWPLVRLSLGLCRLLLFREPAHESDLARLRLYRQLRWMHGLLPVPLAIVVILQAVAVNPLLAALLDRISMLALLLITVPLFGLRDLAVRSLTRRFGRGVWTSLGSGLATTIPLVMLFSAAAGLIGYTRLAASIALVMGQAGLVLIAAVLAQHMLGDAHARLASRWSARPEGAFTAQYLLRPGYQILCLLVFALGAWLLTQWYGLSGETPGVRQLAAVWNATLLSIGDSPIRLRNVVATVVFVWLVFWVARWCREVLSRSLASRVPDAGLRHSLATFAQYLVVVVGLMLAVQALGLKLTSLAIFAGALGVGLGFGLQNIANNFVSGILLLAERPLRNRDLVKIDAFEGEVTHIGIRSLTVRTWDNEEVVIPNSEVISKPFTNWTRGDDVLRTVFHFGVSYKADPHAVREGIAQILADDESIMSDPPPAVLLSEFSDSAVTFRIQYFIHMFGTHNRLQVRSRVLFAIWDLCREKGYEIPFPQRDVHLYTHHPEP